MAYNYGITECATCGQEFQKTGPRSKYCGNPCVKERDTFSRECVHCGTAFKTRDRRTTHCKRLCAVESGAYAEGGRVGGRSFRIHDGADGWHPNAPEIIKTGEWGTPKSWSDDNGYILYYWDHEHVKYGRIHEHRAVGYALWGDLIVDMHVDHMDANRSNNDPSNLQLLTPSEHGKKTAMFEGHYGFYSWALANHPELVEEWRSHLSGVSKEWPSVVRVS